MKDSTPPQSLENNESSFVISSSQGYSSLGFFLGAGDQHLGPRRKGLKTTPRRQLKKHPFIAPLRAKLPHFLVDTIRVFNEKRLGGTTKREVISFNLLTLPGCSTVSRKLLSFWINKGFTNYCGGCMRFFFFFWINNRECVCIYTDTKVFWRGKEINHSIQLRISKATL